MMKPTSEALGAMPEVIRYAYYVVTACRPVTRRTWLAEGAPNPFVKRSKRPARKPIDVDVMQEDLSRFLPLVAA